jgi:shikimate kinase
MKNIVLIGMPASGKSTIGVILAKTMGMDFVDTDLLIQKKEEKLLQDIIIEKGIDSFIQIEEDTILELNCNNHVIATGGSVIYSHKAMQHLRQGGILIYLNTSYDEIERRLTNITSRGIVFGKEQDLHGLFKERTPLYEKYADIVLDCTDKEVEDIVNLIKDNLA